MLLLTALVVGVVGLAGSGVAGFMLVRAGSDLPGHPPAPCGSGSYHCVPVMDPRTVVTAHTEQGFVCEQSELGSNRHECRLVIGSFDYSTTVTVENGKLRGVRAALYYNPGRELSSGATAYVSWLVTVPFAEDRPAAEAARRWLAERLGSEGERTATVRGYEYQLVQESGYIEIYINGGDGW